MKIGECRERLINAENIIENLNVKLARAVARINGALKELDSGKTAGRIVTNVRKILSRR